MAYHLLTGALAFALGVTVGGFAVDQQQKPDPSEEKRVTQDRGAVASLTVSGSSPHGPEDLVTMPDIETAASDSDKRDKDPLEIELGPISESGQIRVLNSRWANLEGMVGRLVKRVHGLEQELLSLKAERTKEEQAAGPAEVMPVSTPDERREALMAAGVPRITADEIVWRQSELELDRLELQDQAMREEWYRSSRYYRELRELNSQDIDLRTEIGDQAYDQYLYQTGEENRVGIASVIQGSEAEQSGLLPGDIVERYGDVRVLDYSDLRGATAQGARGETVPVLIRRGDSLIEVMMVRGPMGVRLKMDIAPPGD